MKKIFIFAATAALLASCAQDEVLNSYEPTAEQAIGFSTITNLQTRAENSTQENKLDLYNYHETFRVDGYKCVNATTKGVEVFKGQVVNVASNNTTSYEPAKYWDKAASYYNFYAAAPAAGWTFTAPTDLTTPNLTTGYYTTSSTLAGVNITTFTGTDAYKYQEYFKKDGDLDKLIASPCKVESSAYNKATADVVQLDFNHILSRLNVEVKSAIEPVYNPQQVTISSTSYPLYTCDEGQCVYDNTESKYYVVEEETEGVYSFRGGSSDKVVATGTIAQVDDETSAKSGEVKLVAITVNGFNECGDFNEDLTAPDPDITTAELAAGTTKRWTSSKTSGENITADFTSSPLNLSVEQNGLLVSAYKYVCQSLVIPQKAEYEVVALDGSGTIDKPYINVKFEIDGQPYSYFYNLAAVFSDQLQSTYEDADGGKYAKTAEGGTAYYEGTKYYSDKNKSEEYEQVVFKSGNATDGYTYKNAEGANVYYKEGSYYTNVGCTEGKFDADVVILGTNANPEFLTNAEAAAGSTPIDANPAACALDFCEGWQNNLKVKIGPSEIKFIGHVYKWDDYKPGELTVE